MLTARGRMKREVKAYVSRCRGTRCTTWKAARKFVKRHAAAARWGL